MGLWSKYPFFPVLLFFPLAWTVPSLSAEGPELNFFASLSQTHGFWTTMRNFQQAVSQDLETHSIWYYADSNQNLGERQVAALSPFTGRQTGAVVTDFKNSAKQLLTLLREKKIPALTFAGVDFQRTGAPRKDNPYWIGALVSDEEETGYLLAKTLIEESLSKMSPEEKNPWLMAGISGDPSSIMSSSRVQGLEKAVREFSPRVQLVQTVPTFRWSQEEGYEKTKALLTRYPDLKLLWCANDDIALGALQAAEEMKKTMGVDLWSGGIDWTPAALEAVRSGKLVCSVGGLAFQAGIASVLLFDHLAGRDFLDDTGTHILLKPALVTRSNVIPFLRNFGDGDWTKVDFRKFSKVLNPRLKKYDFSLEAITAAVTPHP